MQEEDGEQEQESGGKYPSIRQLRHLLADFKRGEIGYPPETYSDWLTFTGTVKLHGTHADVIGAPYVSESEDEGEGEDEGDVNKDKRDTASSCSLATA